MLKKANIIEEPWGHEEIWARSSRYVGKLLLIKKGQRLSRQYHKVKEETILVLEGILVCESGPYYEGDTTHTVRLGQGMTFHIPPGTIHRFSTEGSDVRLVEVSTPEIDDIERIEDDYGRPTTTPPTLPQDSGK